MQIYENMFEYLDFYFLLMALSLVIRPVALYLFGAYKPYKKNILNYSVRIIAPGVLSSGLIFFILLMAKDIFKAIYGLPRAVVLFDAGLSLLLLLTHHVLQVLHGELQPTENMQVKLITDLKEWLRRAMAYFSPIVLGLSTYLLFNRFYAGTAMPVSGQIKRWWGTLPNTVYGRPISSLNGVLEGLLSPNKEKGPFWLLMRPLTRVVDWLLNTFGILKFKCCTKLHDIIVAFSNPTFHPDLFFRDKRAERIAENTGNPVHPSFLRRRFYACSFIQGERVYACTRVVLDGRNVFYPAPV